MPAQSAELKVELTSPDVPGKANQLCGFKEGMTVLIYDDSGNYDTVHDHAGPGPRRSISSTTRTTCRRRTTRAPRSSRCGSHTYYLKTDVATEDLPADALRRHRDADVPVVDNVVGLKFEYHGDPQPPIDEQAAHRSHRPVDDLRAEAAGVGVDELRVQSATDRRCPRRGCRCSGRAA